MQSMKGRKIQFSVSIPYELYEQVCKDVYDNRRSKATIVTEALKKYYDSMPKEWNLRDMMFKILRVNKVDKGSLQFTLDISVPKWGNFAVYGLQIMQKEGRRWLSFPSKKVELPSGETRFLPYCRFESRETHDAFSSKVFESLEAWLAAGNVPQQYVPKEPAPIADRPAYGPGSGDSYSVDGVPF